MRITLNTKQQYNRAGNLHETIRDNGYKVTQMLTNQVWVDEKGNCINVDRAPVRWDIAAEGRISK